MNLRLLTKKNLPAMSNRVVMEECKGGDLFDKIVNNGIRLPEDRAREIVGCLLDAIAYLHERDIVHRDLKVSPWFTRYLTFLP